MIRAAAADDQEGEPMEVLGTVLTTLLGTAGLASLATAASQLGQSARLRARIEKNSEAAQRFEPTSVAARSLQMAARDAALELAARQSVRMTGLDQTVALFPLGGAAFGFWALWRLLDEARPAIEAAAEANKIDVSWALNADFISVFVFTCLMGTAAQLPWYQLARERRKFVAELMDEGDALLSRADVGDVRVRVDPFPPIASTAAWIARRRKVRRHLVRRHNGDMRR
jgi:hypothetical protein